MNTSEKEKNSTLLNSSDTDITYDTYIDDLSHYELTQTNNQMISTIRPLLKEMYKNKEIVNLLHEYRFISMEEYDSSYNDILNYLKNDGEISSNTMSKSEEILKQLDSLLCLFVNNH